MRILKSIGLYLLAPPFFIWEWLDEQPHAIKMAWLSSFAEAHAMVRKVWKSGEPS